MKICCNKPRFCNCICHKWLSVGWVFAILVLWRLCFCFDSTGFTAMTSLSRKRIIIMPSTNDNKLGGVFHLHSTRCIIRKIQGMCRNVEIHFNILRNQTLQRIYELKKEWQASIWNPKILILRNTPQRLPVKNIKVVWPLVFFQSVNTFESFCEVIVTQTLQSKA